MKRLIRILVALLGLIGAARPDGAAAEVGVPASGRDDVGAQVLGEALAALDRSDWTAFDGLAGAVGDPLAGKLLFWLEAVRNDAPLDFAALNAFLTANPGWPRRALLLRRAEEALPEDMPAPAVVAWFGTRQPSTPYGQYRLATALLGLGKQTRAREIARTAWRSGEEFPPELEVSVRATFGTALTPADHLARLDVLLWSGRFTAARRLFDVIDSNHRALAEARIRLRLQSGNVDAFVNAVPAALADDPGLIYERVRWRRKNGQELAASALLAQVKGDPGRPDLWWIERNALARDALQLGHGSEAYRLVRDHSLSDPGDYAEAEWLAGWIALRFLGEARTAQAHFVNMFRVVHFPISVARAAYWAARAGDAFGDHDSARAWDQTAAAHPTTFYGRLSAKRLAVDNPTLPPDAEPDAGERKAFAAHEFVRAVRLLSAYDQGDAIRTFIRALAEISPSPGWQAMTTALASEAGGASLGVTTAKQAMRNGYTLVAHAYPTMTLPDLRAGAPYPVDPALVLAMIRQESGFDLKAVSPAGARGLMQLMPETARRVAGAIDVEYSPDRLTTDGAYNVELGQSYLSTLLEDFDGSYVLAFAAYNAGPARVRQWLDAYGDPRRGDVDAIDWIEMLPFEETRNYVQRAIENMWVYQARLGGGRSLAATDLVR
ncbi:MAG: lytic transglycosylase domain-containing protein [Rhodospirillales bacterium]|nr:lytic transglycosylase domain-containing protein [Rhodospirillales bacterium]